MVAYWLLKTDPRTFSYDDLKRAGTAPWAGPRSGTAHKNLRAMAPNSLVWIFHSGDEQAIIGVAEVVSGPYSNPLAIDVAARGRLARPISLAEIKQWPEFAAWELLQRPRLTIVPVRPEWWERILQIAQA